MCDLYGVDRQARREWRHVLVFNFTTAGDGVHLPWSPVCDTLTCVVTGSQIDIVYK